MNALPASFTTALLLAVSSLGAQRTVTMHMDLRIDGGANNLSAIDGISVSPHGVIAILQPQDMQVRFFDAKGSSLGAFGRSGAGPGEFRELRSPGWIADTFYVEDEQNRRVTLLKPDLKVLRVIQEHDQILPPRGVQGGALSSGGIVMGMFADGSVVFYVEHRAGVGPWHPAQFADFIHVDPAWRFLHDIPVVGNADRHCDYGPARVDIPWCNHFRLNDERAVAVATVSGPPGQSNQAVFHLQVTSSRTGKTTISRDISFTPIPIPARVRDSVRHEWATSRDVRPERRAQAAGLQLPAAYPPVERILVGDDMVVWLEESHAVTGAHRWLVLDSRGNPVARVLVPAKVRLEVVRGLTAWGVMTDEDGGESVVREVASSRS